MPGRALSTQKLYGQVALPRLDSVPDPAGSALTEAATLVRSAWTGPLPPPVRVLPAVLHATGTGKTNLLRLVADALVQQYSPEELVFAVFDPWHGLADVVPESYNGGYAPNPASAQQLAMAVCKELPRRDPSSLARGESPPRIVLLIDDYDILAASATQPLSAFVPYLAAGRDLGLHVMLTRRVAGASRGLYEPFTLGVCESGCLALLMFGDRMEGQLFAGVRPSTLPVARAQYVRPGHAVRTVRTAYFPSELRSK